MGRRVRRRLWGGRGRIAHRPRSRRRPWPTWRSRPNTPRTLGGSRRSWLTAGSSSAASCRSSRRMCRATTSLPITRPREVGGDFFDLFRLRRRGRPLSVADRGRHQEGHRRGPADGVRSAAPPRRDRPYDRPCRGARAHEQDPGRGAALVAVHHRARWTARPPTGHLRLANAGHEPPLILHADGSPPTWLEGAGPLVGGFHRLDVPEITVDLGPGDLALLYTDGITDARNPPRIGSMSGACSRPSRWPGEEPRRTWSPRSPTRSARSRSHPAGRRHHGRGNPAAARRVTIVLDGGLATELEARGHNLSDWLWSARLLLSEPNAIEEVHLAYFRAGARVAITASYQASVEGFAAAGLDRPTAIEAIRRSVELAQRAYTVPGRGGGSRPRSGPHARRWIGRPVRRDARGRLGIPRRL